MKNVPEFAGTASTQMSAAGAAGLPARMEPVINPPSGSLAEVFVICP
jgi:hypothetical protein